MNNKKCDTMIELTFLKELMLVKQLHQKKVCNICYYWYFLNKRLKFQS